MSICLILFSLSSKNKVRRFKFHLPDYYVALVRALLTLEGIALAADCHLKKLGVGLARLHLFAECLDMCFFFTACQLVFFRNCIANSYDTQKLVMIRARAAFYSAGVDTLWVSKMRGPSTQEALTTYKHHPFTKLTSFGFHTAENM